MTINRKIAPKGLRNNPNKPLKSISYITIHTTGNTKPNATAKMNADYQAGGSGGREASWHYTVDANEIWQSFEDTQMCWHAGDGSGDGNSRSIAIEICDNDKANFPKACKNAAWLVSELMRRHGIPLDNVKQHYDWSGKDCPKEIRAGNWGVNWKEFLKMIQDIIDKITNTPSDWASEAWDWGVKSGVIADDNPRANVTKEQVITMIYKARKV